MSETKHDWTEVVLRKPKGYCEIQNHEEGLVFHGPVEKVEIDEATDLVLITLKWVAQTPLPGRGPTGQWKKAPDSFDKVISFPNFVVPYRIQSTERGDRALFGINIIYFEDEGFGPERVEGLEHLARKSEAGK